MWELSSIGIEPAFLGCNSLALLKNHWRIALIKYFKTDKVLPWI